MPREQPWDDAPIPEPDDASGARHAPWGESDEVETARRAAGPAPKPATQHTDLGNAERYAEQHNASVRYCAHLGGWYIWSGSHWTKDETLTAQRRGHETARRLYVEVEEIAARLKKVTDTTERERLEAMLEAAAAHAKRSEHSSRIAAMLHEARAIEPIPAAWQSFDAASTSLLLNCPNGTLDLVTGTMRPHRREDLITRCTTVRYDASATAPRFLAFLERVLPDAEVRAFMRRWAGYATTGVIREHVLPIWYGTGANGKGTLAELLVAILGEYAQTAPEGFLEETKHRGHPTEVARLRAARLVVASETERAAHLAESRVKQLTGGDTLSGRHMRCDFIQFAPTHKLVLLTNHPPRIRSTDDGIRRRILLVPFQVVIPPEERNATLGERLLADEGPGILRWIVEGARELLAANGRLHAPASIQAATADYLAGEDVVGRWIEEGCTVLPSLRTRPADLFAAFRRWCDEAGEAPSDQRELATRLKARGYDVKKSHGVRWYLGIAPIERRQGHEPHEGDDWKGPES